ncbi:MAG: branched-chain amino acid transaminase [Acidisphaera sp.]|nr:branched-chain amino acid transaminase [Acidisphaera sp.]
MPAERPRLLFLDGRNVAYQDANVHVLGTAFKYAATIFEGIRAYHNERTGQLYVFRLAEHLDRLFESAGIVRMELPYSRQEFTDHLLALIRENALRQDLHIRISAFVTEDNGRLDSVGPVGVAMAAMPMGRYDAGLPGGGLHVCVSAWRRIGDAAMPPRVKTSANYHNSRLAILDARAAGFQDTILLDERGRVTEGPGYNLFVVRGGQVLTPPVTSGILEGVTRDTLIRLFAGLHDMKVTEREIDRTELYVADEAFFCGSGKEVTPIASVDHRPLRVAAPGPWTERIRQSYFAVAKGEHPHYAEWLLPVY